MHCKRVAFGLLAAAAAVAAADDSDVTQLKKDTFDDFVKTNDLVLAECECFFAPSCMPLNPANHALQSLLPGAATARPSPPSTRRLPHP